MIQQDYTAPEYAVRVSRREQYWDVFEVVGPDGQTPDNSLAAALFRGDLLDASGTKVATATCTHPSLNSVRVGLSTSQMNALRAGRYRLEVYSVDGSEREDLVAIQLTVE